MNKILSSIVVFIFALHLSAWKTETHCTLGTAHASEITRIHDGARLVDYDGCIMSVDRFNRLILMNEIRFVVGQFMVGNKVLATRMEDSIGIIADIGHFRCGNMVSIRGYSVSESEIFAVSIKAATGYIQKDPQRIDKLENLSH